MKKKFIARKTGKQTIAEMAWNCVGIQRYRKRGKYTKRAIMVMGYGGGF